MKTEHHTRKTLRHFHCRDALWETFERMASDVDRSIDSLINEAMADYSLGRQPPARPEGEAAKRSASSSSVTPPAAPRVASGRPSLPPPPPLARAGRSVAPLSPAPVAARGGGRRAEPPASEREEGTAPGATLYLLFAGRKIAIEKDQFVIGRGSRTCDLPIKDGNISRKHAAVLRRSGSYFLKDLGSTNGIDFRGMRIDNKRIDEGDVFHLCDYELRFTYQS